MTNDGQQADSDGHLLPELMRALNDAPRNYHLRSQIVAAMGALGKREQALEAALNLSDHLIQQGYILPALAVLCESKAYDGFSSPLIQTKLQKLHRESTVSEDQSFDDIFELGDLPREPIDDLDPDRLQKLSIEAQVQAVGNFLKEPALHSTRGIPVPIPLFSEMSCEQFIRAVPDLSSNHAPKDAVLFKEGDAAESILIIVSGEANVMRGGERVARLESGSVVGAMTLINQSIRRVDVVATSDVTYLEIKGTDVWAWCEDSPGFEIELRRFCTNRMIQNLIRTSDLFSHFDIATGSLLAESFTKRSFSAQDVLITCGEPGEGLWLFAKGEIEVSVPTPDGNMSRVATLVEGEIAGEISLMTALPTTAQLVAKTDGWALFLDKADFQRLVDQHPDVSDYIEELSQQRLADQYKVF